MPREVVFFSGNSARMVFRLLLDVTFPKIQTMIYRGNTKRKRDHSWHSRENRSNNASDNVILPTVSSKTYCVLKEQVNSRQKFCACLTDTNTFCCCSMVWWYIFGFYGDARTRRKSCRVHYLCSQKIDFSFCNATPCNKKAKMNVITTFCQTGSWYFLEREDLTNAHTGANSKWKNGKWMDSSQVLVQPTFRFELQRELKQLLWTSRKVIGIQDDSLKIKILSNSLEHLVNKWSKNKKLVWREAWEDKR